jgi:hypothetical protein
MIPEMFEIATGSRFVLSPDDDPVDIGMGHMVCSISGLRSMTQGNADGLEETMAVFRIWEEMDIEAHIPKIFAFPLCCSWIHFRGAPSQLTQSTGK